MVATIIAIEGLSALAINVGAKRLNEDAQYLKRST